MIIVALDILIGIVVYFAFFKKYVDKYEYRTWMLDLLLIVAWWYCAIYLFLLWWFDNVYKTGNEK